ncbi:MAG: sodium/glutamate symporter family protein [Planctomycetota bacterium]
MQWAILVASGLLLIGFVLRVRVRLLQVLFVPASVIGGLLGLLCVQAAGSSSALAEPAAQLAGTLRSWPAPLIAVVFAGLLMEHPSRSFVQSLRGAALAGIAVWIIVLGQVLLGLLATWLVIRHRYEVPAAFGQLIEAGFAGGHGTATALGTIYADVLAFPAGSDLALFVATVGLIYSVVSGIVLVNIAVRRGWTRSGRIDVRLISGLEAREAPTPVALGRVRSEVIDPFAFQLLLVAGAFLIGAGLRAWFIEGVKHGSRLIEHFNVGSGDELDSLENVPLFLFTLLGGLLLRKMMTAFGVGDLIDAESIKRIVGIAMEFLIVAAIASLRLSEVATFGWPLLLLLLLGCVWTAICLLVISRQLLPRDYWFELGILNYGMSTGTTAQGMMLLRIVDRDLESGAAEDYALAAPLSAPFVGGGIITMTLPLLLTRVGMPAIVGVLAFTMVALYLAGLTLNAAGRRGTTPGSSSEKPGVSGDQSRRS